MKKSRKWLSLGLTAAMSLMLLSGCGSAKEEAAPATAETTSVTNLNGSATGPTTAQTKTYTVTGLSLGTTYYFKAIVYDVAGNQVSSTVISAKTANPTAGDISYTPSDSSWKVDNVKSALDALYSR